MEADRGMLAEAVRHLCRNEAIALRSGNGKTLLASAYSKDAVTAMASAASPTTPMRAILGFPQQLNGWLPGLSPRARRVSRRCWPGEVVIQFAEGWRDGLISQLPADVRTALLSEDRLALHLPAHSTMVQIAQRIQSPLLAVCITTETHTTIPSVGYTLDVASSESDVNLARLLWENDTTTILDKGSYEEAQLGGLTDLVVLFLCSGNTCRSPMAEAICKSLLAAEMGSSIPDLPTRGIHVFSAGLAAGAGSPASPQAVAAAQAYGADLSQHVSQPLNLTLLQDADYIFTMTQQHFRSLHGRIMPGTTVELLSPEGQDLNDPFGAEQTEYNSCAVKIYEHLQTHLPRLLMELQAEPARPAAGSDA